MTILTLVWCLLYKSNYCKFGNFIEDFIFAKLRTYFVKIKPLRNDKITLSFTDIDKLCLSREVWASHICLLTLFTVLQITIAKFWWIEVRARKKVYFITVFKLSSVYTMQCCNFRYFIEGFIALVYNEGGVGSMLGRCTVLCHCARHFRPWATYRAPPPSPGGILYTMVF